MNFECVVPYYCCSYDTALVRRRDIHHSRVNLQRIGMGVQPAPRVKCKRSLAPLEPAPRAPAAAAFVTPGAVQQGGSNGVARGRNNSNWIERGTTSSAAASNDQGGGNSLEGWRSDTTGSAAADAISATLAGYDTTGCILRLRRMKYSERCVSGVKSAVMYSSMYVVHSNFRCSWLMVAAVKCTDTWCASRPSVTRGKQQI